MVCAEKLAKSRRRSIRRRARRGRLRPAHRRSACRHCAFRARAISSACSRSLAATANRISARLPGARSRQPLSKARCAPATAASTSREAGGRDLGKGFSVAGSMSSMRRPSRGSRALPSMKGLAAESSQGLCVEVPQILAGDRHRIRGVATVLECLVGERVELRLVHAMRAQARRESDLVEERRAPRRSWRHRVGSLQSQARCPTRRYNARLPRGIEFHDERQAQRIGQSVMQPAERRKRMRQRVRGAQILSETRCRPWRPRSACSPRASRSPPSCTARASARRSDESLPARSRRRADERPAR